MDYSTLDGVKKRVNRYEEKVRLAKEKLDHDLDKFIKTLLDRIDAGVFLDFSRVFNVGILEREGYKNVYKVIDLLKDKFEELNKQCNDYFKEIIIMHDDEKEWPIEYVRIKLIYSHLPYQLKKEEAATFDKLLSTIIGEVYYTLLEKENVVLLPLKQLEKFIHTLDYDKDAKARSYVLSFVMDKLKFLGYDAATVSEHGEKPDLNELAEDKFNNNGYWLKINLG